MKDRGKSTAPVDLEAWLATQAHAMVTNCGGTLSLGRNPLTPSFSPDRYPQRFVTHRVRTSQNDIDPVIRVLGSAEVGASMIEKMDALHCQLNGWERHQRAQRLPILRNSLVSGCN